MQASRQKKITPRSRSLEEAIPHCIIIQWARMRGMLHDNTAHLREVQTNSTQEVMHNKEQLETSENEC